MPWLHETMAQQKALAEAPTLGNLHPDARDQAIARAGIAEAEAMRKRMDFLHRADSVDKDGYEWGVFRVKWENGRAVDVQRVRADHSDLDAAIHGVPAPAIAEVVESQPDAIEAHIKWLLNPMPVGTLLYEAPAPGVASVDGGQQK